MSFDEVICTLDHHIKIISDTKQRTRVMILKTKIVLRVSIVSQVKFEKKLKMLGLDGI